MDLLKTEHDNQRDNKYRPYEVCNMCSAWTFIKYFRPDFPLNSDDLYTQANTSKMWDWIKANVPGSSWIKNFFDIKSANQVWCVIERLIDIHLAGIGDCYFKGINSYKQIETEIKVNKNPVIVGTSLTGAGHIIVIVGIEDFGGDPNKQGYFICQDPYGDANTNYANPDGKEVHYTYNFLWNKIYKDRGLFFRKT
jgi:hypothetical protein